MSKCFVPDAGQLCVIGPLFFNYIFFSFINMVSGRDFLGEYGNPGSMGAIGIQILNQQG